MWVQTGAYQLGSLWWLIAVIVIFVIAVIALIVAGSALARARAMTRAGGAYTRGAVGGPDDGTLPESNRMLDERYARGEISREEYMQRQVDLKARV